MHFATGQRRTGLTSLACPHATFSIGGSESPSRQQKSVYGCPPLPIPCCWCLCFTLFLSRWFCWLVKECQIQPQSTPDEGRGGGGMGQTLEATKTSMGGGLMHFAAGQPATMKWEEA